MKKFALCLALVVMFGTDLFAAPVAARVVVGGRRAAVAIRGRRAAVVVRRRGVRVRRVIRGRRIGFQQGYGVQQQQLVMQDYYQQPVQQQIVQQGYYQQPVQQQIVQQDYYQQPAQQIVQQDCYQQPAQQIVQQDCYQQLGVQQDYGVQQLSVGPQLSIRQRSGLALRVGPLRLRIGR